MWHLTGIHLSHVRGEDGEGEGFCITSYCPARCLGLRDPGERSWGQVENVCRQQGRLPRGFRQCSHLGLSFHFLPFQPGSGRELRTPGETVGTAGQGKGRLGRINSKTLPWRAGKDKKKMLVIRTKLWKAAAVKPARLGVIGEGCPAVPGLSLGTAWEMMLSIKTEREVGRR